MTRATVSFLLAGACIATTGLGEVLAPAGAVGIAYGTQGIVVAVDAKNEGKDADGIVDYVFTYYQDPQVAAPEAKTASGGTKTERSLKPPKVRTVRLDNANVEYWGDRLIVTSEAHAFALELSMKGAAPLGPRNYPEHWRTERRDNGLGLARLIDSSGGIRLWREAGKRDPDSMRRAEEWWPDEQDWGGFGGSGHSPSCQAGGFGSSSCSISCGMDPVRQTATTSCHPPLYACCYCDFARAYAVCRA